MPERGTGLLVALPASEASAMLSELKGVWRQRRGIIGGACEPALTDDDGEGFLIFAGREAGAEPFPQGAGLTFSNLALQVSKPGGSTKLQINAPLL